MVFSIIISLARFFFFLLLFNYSSFPFSTSHSFVLNDRNIVHNLSLTRMKTSRRRRRRRRRKSIHLHDLVLPEKISLPIFSSSNYLIKKIYMQKEFFCNVEHLFNRNYSTSVINRKKKTFSLLH